MGNIYRPASEISFRGKVAVQLGTLAGNALGNNVPSDAKLVFENGIWKYPQLTTSGAVEVTAPCRLVGVLANLGASVAWTLMLAGNASNATDTPYPSGDAALYLEPLVQIATGTSQYVALQYPTHALPTLTPGQRVYMTAPAGATTVQFRFAPEL